MEIEEAKTNKKMMHVLCIKSKRRKKRYCFRGFLSLGGRRDKMIAMGPRNCGPTASSSEVIIILRLGLLQL